MKANPAPVITLRMEDVAALRLRGSGLETLRGLAGVGARALGHDLGPGYAFLAVDAGAAFAGALKELTRSFVFLPDLGELIAFDLAVSPEPPAHVVWQLQGSIGANQLATLLPRGARVARSGSGLQVQPGKFSTESQFLNVIHLGEKHPIGEIGSDDLAGLRIAERVILFFTETRTARSAVSFDVAGPAALKILVTGVAPGTWEIWRAGMLEISDGTVAPEAGALYFEGKPGSYFLRRLGS